VTKFQRKTNNLEIKVRPSGVLIEDNQILLIKQKVTENRGWSLPGGALEVGELKEETGLDISVGELLYITDRFHDGTHVVHITFLVERIPKDILNPSWKHIDDHASNTSGPTREIKMIPVNELTDYGFPATFARLAREGFPSRGYKGDFLKFYGGL
jgi:ADP-ribose pyrophosphatase YjhB (NUDIX family)